jgi:hypothetical protein
MSQNGFPPEFGRFFEKLLKKSGSASTRKADPRISSSGSAEPDSLGFIVSNFLAGKKPDQI